MRIDLSAICRSESFVYAMRCICSFGYGVPGMHSPHYIHLCWIVRRDAISESDNFQPSREAVSFRPCLTPAISTLASLRWLLRDLQLPRARDQFLELSLDGRITDVLVLQNAIRVDRKRMRNGFHREELRDRSRESSVAVVQPRHAVVRDVVFPLLF